MIEVIKEQYKSLYNDKAWWESFVLSILLLAMSLIINYYTGTYATAEVSNPVTDIILSNIPVFDVDGAFVYGAFLMIAIIVSICLYYPRRMPFVVKSIALFYVIRSISVSLTHIAPFPGHVVLDPSSTMRFFNFDGQLFFSGHTGLPFLIGLIFWKNIRLRILFIAFSLTFAAIVLMGHLHYSIDVLAAFFMTYGIYHIAEIIFKTDHERQ